MQVAPDCLVVTWPLLAHQGEIPKEILRVRKGKLSTDVFTFKLGVMVAHKTRHMCLFRYIPYFGLPYLGILKNNIKAALDLYMRGR